MEWGDIMLSQMFYIIVLYYCYPLISPMRIHCFYFRLSSHSIGEVDFEHMTTI